MDLLLTKTKFPTFTQFLELLFTQISFFCYVSLSNHIVGFGFILFCDWL